VPRPACANPSPAGRTAAAPPQHLGGAPVPTEIRGAARQFHCLSPAEQQEWRRQGLCYNCDEPYIHGHVCERLFYLESDDFINENILANVLVATRPHDHDVVAGTDLGG
jgi:hypothetical protein